MASTCSKQATPRVVALCVLAAASACGRENVELYPGFPAQSAGSPSKVQSGGGAGNGGNGGGAGNGGNGGRTGGTSPPPEQCDAVVPAGLLYALPVMGWNGFNYFGCTAALNEAKVRDTADVLVSSGMQAVGYRYVDLDDCWELARTAAGDIQIDPAKLPSGMAMLGSYLHDQGFQFGVFRAAGDCPRTAANHYVGDAATYASWNIDLLKFVMCTAEVNGQSDFEHMASALSANVHPTLLSLADPPFADWMANETQMSRTNAQIHPTWASVLANLDANIPLAPYTRPGAFNDPDMLEVGNGTLSESEQRSHFSLWSIMSAPLLAGNDLTTMTEPTRAVLTNSEVIALDQDPLGLQGALVSTADSLQILAKPLTGCGARGVVLFNRGETVASATLHWSDLGLSSGSASVRDLWAHLDLGSWQDELDLSVQPHDVMALRVVGVEPATPHGVVALGDAPWTYAANFFGPVERNTSNGEDSAGDGGPLQIGNQMFAHGLGVHAPSLVRFRLGGGCTRFSAQVGVDNEVAGQGSVIFQVWSDGEKLFDSGTLTGQSAPVPIDVSLVGRQDLRLFVGADLGDTAHDHADWVDPRLTCD